MVPPFQAFRAREDLDHQTQGVALGYPSSPPLGLRMQAKRIQNDPLQNEKSIEDKVLNRQEKPFPLSNKGLVFPAIADTS